MQYDELKLLFYRFPRPQLQAWVRQAQLLLYAGAHLMSQVLVLHPIILKGHLILMECNDRQVMR